MLIFKISLLARIVRIYKSDVFMRKEKKKSGSRYQKVSLHKEPEERNIHTRI